jgi:AraC family L-rhamnose operon regulatory protein RhaS
MQTRGRYDVMARGLFLTLAAELSDAAERIDEKKRKQAELERVVATFWEQSLSENLDQEWTLDSMAKACRLGRTRFAEITKALYADPPMGKLARTRIEGSLQMMQTTDASVTEIAHACGFSSSQYFATVFRAFHNTPPSQAMRAIRAKAGK